jgi:sulfatase maturation enzyme AslB (radical SAM superfamily)
MTDETETGGRTRWPLPDRVASYGTLEEFGRARTQAGQWVFWADRVQLVLEGRYDEVRPLHIELSPTYLCNFACPWCSCRSAREEWSDADVFNHPRATPMTVMRDAKLDRILTHLADDKVGIMWVGGEPTMNPLLYPAALKADRLGLAQCLFTNGSLLNEQRISALFDANLVFVRLSLNAVSKDTHAAYHDYDPSRGHVDRVLRNLETLAKIRAQRRSLTLVGVSVVVDEGNIADLETTAAHLARLCETYGPGAIDYAIFRPAFPFYTAQIDMRDDTVSKFLDVMGPEAPQRRLLAEHGIDIVVPDQSTAQPDPPDQDDRGCIAAGWFGEVTPNGDIVVCSDRYGNPDYVIGNVAQATLDELWAGPGRRRVLQLARQTGCFQTYCPSNGRGFFFNRLFREVEKFRRAGRMNEVTAWIDDLRAVLPTPGHSFFI